MIDPSSQPGRGIMHSIDKTVRRSSSLAGLRIGLISGVMGLLAACAATLPAEGVRWLEDSATVESTRCQQFTKYSGRNAVADKAESEAKASAVEAVRTRVQTRFSAATSCTGRGAERDCDRQLEDRLQTASSGFLERAETEISEHRGDIVCVTVRGTSRIDPVERPSNAVTQAIPAASGRPDQAASTRAGPQPARRPVAPSLDDTAHSLIDRTQWQAWSGDWEVKDGALYGRDGHIMTRTRYRDFILSAVVEHVSGPRNQTVAIGWRFSLFPGGRGVAKGTHDWHGYGYNFAFTGTGNMYRGFEGDWWSVMYDSNRWRAQAPLEPQRNEITLQARGNRFRVWVNGQFLHEFTDTTHPQGSIYLWVQNPAQQVRFTKLRIQPE
jgi:hypothetical protein